MAREVVLDANVIVALLDSADALAAQANILGVQLQSEGADLVLFDTVARASWMSGGSLRRSRERRQRMLQREEVIGDVASFDTGFDTVPDFRRVAGAPGSPT